MTDTTVLDNVTQSVEGSLAHTVDNPSAQILRAIEAVEDHLREKRNRIEEIQLRRDRLVDEIERLNKTLESENIDFVSNLSAVVDDLEANGEIVGLLPDVPAADETSDVGANGADRDQQAGRSPDKKQVKRGSLRWLKEKERSRWES